MEIEPRGKGRPRTTIRGRHAQVYTDPKTRAYEAKVAEIAALYMNGNSPLQGPLSVSLRFRYPIPVSYSKKLRAAILDGSESYVGPYDIDNYAKALLDGCNKILFEDDAQITKLLVIKKPSLRPGIDIRVEAIAQSPNI